MAAFFAPVAGLFGGFGGFSSVIGGVGSIVSGMSAASAAQAQADAQARAYEYNAAVSRNNAIAARQAALAEAQQQDRLNSARLGKLTTQIIKQGVALEGTPLLILDEEFEQGELESKKKIYTGEIQATNYQNDSNLQRFYASQARAAGESQASQSMLGGVIGGLTRFAGGK